MTRILSPRIWYHVPVRFEFYCLRSKIIQRKFHLTLNNEIHLKIMSETFLLKLFQLYKRRYLNPTLAIREQDMIK